MEKSKKIILGILIMVIIIIVSVGSYFAYEMYMDSKYDESYKLRTQYAVNSMNNIENSDKVANDTQLLLSDEKSYYTASKTYIANAISDIEKAIYYSKEMKKYANSNVEKQYAEAQIKLYESKLEQTKEYNNYIISIENGGDSSSSYQYFIQLGAKNEKLDKERQEILTKNPDFKQRMNKLYNETMS